MATYKVPQDVEAEDKLIAFLSLKQFIFVIVMIASLWMCWVLGRVNILLGIIPLPIALVSGVLGLYQRKDQPVETFLASWLQFKFKPRTRAWDQEGLEEHVIINAPKIIEHQYTKGFTREQVSSHLNQLSSMLDSRGWASKHSFDPNQQTQRLFSMDELRQYARPAAPIEAEEDTVADQFDSTDPRNRTVQEVSKDIEGTSKKQQQHTQAIIEKARKEAGDQAPAPGGAQDGQTLQTSGVAPTREPIKPVVKQQVTQKKPTSTKPEKQNNEVVIDLHNQHKA